MTFLNAVFFLLRELTQALVSPNKIFSIYAAISRRYSRISIHFPGFETRKVNTFSQIIPRNRGQN